jgi:hypothetical protein
MENERDKIKEPFNPHQTPPPPQVIDPSRRKEQGETDAPIGNRKPAENSKKEKRNPEPKKERSKQLGDETEITDETTI